MKLLVTGSAGLIGSDLMMALRSAGHDAIGFDIADDPVQDICNLDAVTRALAGCDGIIHLAAISRVAWGEADPVLCNHVNVTGTKVLLRAAKDVGAWFLFVSSREIYGDPEHSPIAESAPRAPVNHYGKSKAEGELLVEAARADGLQTAILRLSNVYGTHRDHPDRAVPSLLWKAMTGADLPITGGENYFDFVHVEDCVRGVLTVIDRLDTGERSLPHLHLTTGVPTSLIDLAEAVIRVTSSSSKVKLLPARSFDVTGFCGDPARAAAVLGWRATVPLDEGLTRLRIILAARGAPPDPVHMPQPGR